MIIHYLIFSYHTIYHIILVCITVGPNPLPFSPSHSHFHSSSPSTFQPNHISFLAFSRPAFHGCLSFLLGLRSPRIRRRGREAHWRDHPSHAKSALPCAQNPETSRLLYDEPYRSQYGSNIQNTQRLAYQPDSESLRREREALERICHFMSE